MLRGSLHPMSQEPARAEPAPVPLSPTGGQGTIQKQESLPALSRESRIVPGSDHGGGSKAERRTAPQPRLVPAQRETQPRGEGDGAQAPAGRDGARSGKGREQAGERSGAGRVGGAFSPSVRWELPTSRVMRSAHDTQDAACHITAPKGDI